GSLPRTRPQGTFRARHPGRHPGLQSEPARPRTGNPRTGKLRATLPRRGALGDPGLRFPAVSGLL
ncbi:MAG: hypothetical protein AVDCRST_MAG55-2357, partial [uncultured Rubrobacteraceae bacterium]